MDEARETFSDLKDGIGAGGAVWAAAHETARIDKEDIVEMVADRPVGVAGDNTVHLVKFSEEKILHIMAIAHAVNEAYSEISHLDYFFKRQGVPGGEMAHIAVHSMNLFPPEGLEHTDICQVTGMENDRNIAKTSINKFLKRVIVPDKMCI